MADMKLIDGPMRLFISRPRELAVDPGITLNRVYVTTPKTKGSIIADTRAISKASIVASRAPPTTRPTTAAKRAVNIM